MDIKEKYMNTNDTIHAAPKSKIKPRYQLAFSSPYAKFSLVLLAITFISLLPNYFKALIAEPGTLSLSLIIHGIIFLAWYILFSLQSALAAGTGINLHKKLGCLSIIFSSFWVVSGSSMLLHAIDKIQKSAGSLEAVFQSSYIWAIVHTLLCFISFYSLAIYYRKNTQIHRRLMILTSLSMMPATITRVAYLPFIPIDGTAFTLLVSYSLLSIPIILDLLKYKKVHPALGYGTAIFVITQMIATALMPLISFN